MLYFIISPISPEAPTEPMFYKIWFGGISPGLYHILQTCISRLKGLDHVSGRIWPVLTSIKDRHKMEPHAGFRLVPISITVNDRKTPLYQISLQSKSSNQIKFISQTEARCINFTLADHFSLGSTAQPKLFVICPPFTFYKIQWRQAHTVSGYRFQWCTSLVYFGRHPLKGH